MVAGNLRTRLPIVIALYHRTAVLVNVGIHCRTFRVCGTAGQRQTDNLPSVLVEQDEHRFDVRRHELESSVAHLNGLEHVLFVQELLSRGRCFAARGIVVVYPRLRIGPGLIDVPT